MKNVAARYTVDGKEGVENECYNPSSTTEETNRAVKGLLEDEQHLTVDEIENSSMASIAFGLNVDSLKDPNAEFFKFNLFPHWVMSLLKIPQLLITVSEFFTSSIFSAGFETSSSTINYTAYELATNPEIQKRLREEINTVLQRHDNKLTYAAIN
ncbi:hypothetical protein NQ318_013459 [Aromia moschata]|uniref:Cytochrome P450 n=1 Tax=Aromia moschata TaxID=1265417 RepID=A0AAV8YMV7_9CUCU|nr:hypothetical protein NQ318_013459 [Aromia moschata]